MKIGIDISQLAHPHTGVANYLKELVKHLLLVDKKNDYILFFSSLRQTLNLTFLEGIKNKKVLVKTFRLPPALLNIIWNTAHSFPIENLLGDLDVFISSDWTQPPTLRAKKATIVYDLIVYKYPNETNNKIVSVQKKRLGWVKLEADLIFCISESTKKDLIEILGIKEEKIRVIYPGAI